MSSAVKPLAGFGLVLAGVFGLAAVVGGALDPSAPAAARAPQGGEPTAEKHGSHSARGEEHGDMAAVRGLAVAEHGLRLVVDQPRRRLGVTDPLRLRLVDDQGQSVRDLELAHTKRLHVIVVRRDLTGFQHLHPQLDATGTWSTPLRLDAPGTYRVFADFVRAGEATTLASDLQVDGAVTALPLPQPRASVRTDEGYVVRQRVAAARAGVEAPLRFVVTGPDGRAVPLEQYLGAGGHLVALREGDLAFLHVHPVTGESESRSGRVDFETTFPSAGRYRLFLQTQIGRQVVTAAFTQEVGQS